MHESFRPLHCADGRRTKQLYGHGENLPLPLCQANRLAV
jgi:hypothetical protein